MSRDTVDIYNPKVIRSTMGSVFRVPFFYTDDLEQTVLDLKARGSGYLRPISQERIITNRKIILVIRRS